MVPEGTSGNAGKLRVALVQYESPGLDRDLSRSRGEHAVRSAAALSADIVVFPEMWQIGYVACPEGEPGRTEWLGQAIHPDDDFIEHFVSLARELELAILITYLQRWPGAPRNVALLIDRHGSKVSTYAKIHTCDYWMEAELTPGSELPVVELDTAVGPVRTGTMICFDREQPETARILMVKGAELVLVPNACHLTDDRIGQFRSRSFENMMAMAMANYTSSADDAKHDYPLNLNGRSVAYSGVVFEEDRTPIDPTLVLAEDAEGIYIADIDLTALRQFRSAEVWADTYRKPSLYGPLLADDPVREFRRSDSRRSRILEV
jgi:predicted amidohydrolase